MVYGCKLSFTAPLTFHCKTKFVTTRMGNLPPQMTIFRTGIFNTEFVMLFIRGCVTILFYCKKDVLFEIVMAKKKMNVVNVHVE